MGTIKKVCRKIHSRYCLCYALLITFPLITIYAVIESIESRVKPEVKDYLYRKELSIKDGEASVHSNHLTTPYPEMEDRFSESSVLMFENTMPEFSSNTFEKEENENEELEDTKSNCGQYGIIPKYKTKLESVSCVPHKPSHAACRFADELYSRDDSLKSCGFSRKVEICKLLRNPKHRHNFKCSMSDCVKYNRAKVALWTHDESGENIITQGVYESPFQLVKAVNYFANLSSSNGHNYIFLECTDGVKDRPAYDVISQFLILPPIELRKKTKAMPATKNYYSGINVNIVLLDSVARAHFFRSLPTVIETFNKINGDATFPAEILDFELFQALEGHTAENLHALFTGTLFPKDWNGADRERSSLGAGKLFGRFAKAGYHNFYQDDLCYTDWWGLRMDMGSPGTWEEYMNALEKNFIQHTGLTFSSCRILKTNNVTNPFTGPDGPLCYNGRFHDAYHLDFVLSRHLFASKHNRSLISFSALNVGHEHIGRRIQSIDLEMANFIKKIALSRNTLTILMADHGNTYTRYTHAIMEGRFEQFHPSLFLILPSNVRNRMGENIVNNLRLNQKKMVTMLDLHDALVNIPVELKESGIFGKISPERTCDDLDLRLPNLCVCEGWDAPTLNNSRQIGVVDFAVGQLNNKIHKYQSKIRAQKIIPNCQRLVPISFANVRERNRGGTLITTLDFATVAGKGSLQQNDIFHVEIQSSIDPKYTSLKMRLLSFDRVSKYGHYRSCGDRGIDMRLCVCNIHSKKEKLSMASFILREFSPEESKLAPSNVELTHKYRLSKCLYFRTISILELSDKDAIFSRSYEVANICDKDITIEISLNLDNMKTSEEVPMKKRISAYGITYICEAIRDVPYWTSRVISSDISLAPPDI